MATHEYQYLHVEAIDDVRVLTLKNEDDNRLNFSLCRELLHVQGVLRRELGQGKDGALIVRGRNNKFFTNVGTLGLFDITTIH